MKKTMDKETDYEVFNKHYETESQNILRLPQEYANKLHDMIRGSGIKDRLFIDFKADQRQGKLNLDGDKLHLKLYDLPCLSETLKTHDKKTFYKTGDISQIMVASTETEYDSDSQISSMSHREKKFLFPHGISAPLKNVRRRRFRKCARKKYGDSPDVQKEVMRLLKADLEADTTSYKLINPEKDEGHSNIAINNNHEEDLNKIFDDLSSSDDDNEVYLEDEKKWDDFSSFKIPTNIQLVTDRKEIEKIEEKLKSLALKITDYQSNMLKKKSLVNGGAIESKKLLEMFLGEYEALKRKFNDSRGEYAIYLAKLGRL